nr:hypothetical protein [Trueperella pyogenes]
MSPSIRRVPTASGATAVQIIWRYRNRKPEIEHVGSAHTDHDLAALMAKAQRLVDGEQISLDLKVLPSAVAVSGTGTVDNPVTVSGERAGLLLDAIRGPSNSSAWIRQAARTRCFSTWSKPGLSRQDPSLIPLKPWQKSA